MPRPRSRLAAIVALFAVALLITGASAASADTTVSTYHAKADATALNLQLFGQGITLGLTHTDVANDPKASGHGTGVLLPGPTAVTDEKYDATAEGDNKGTASPPVCGPVTLPPSFPVISLATACADATAAIGGALPTSTANASVANLGVNASDILGQLPIKDITNQSQALIDALKPIFDAVKQDAGLDAQSLVAKLLQDINGNDPLLRVTLGPSHSTSAAVAGTVSAAASAEGAVIDVLPRDALSETLQADPPLQPVIKILVGAASNTIDVDRTTGVATVHFEPSIVHVTIAPDVFALLPGHDSLPNPITVGPGPDPTCLPLPAPLTSCITVASGSTTKLADGTTRAEAAGVSLHLLTGVQGGLQLDLAGTAVEGFAATDISRDAPAPPDLARTGGTVDTMLGGSLFAVAVGGMMLVRRSRRGYELL